MQVLKNHGDYDLCVLCVRGNGMRIDTCEQLSGFQNNNHSPGRNGGTVALIAAVIGNDGNGERQEC
ncbi:hypothetical protein QE435_002381 [Rhizobium sp. SORGH_AS 787]|nr:hypothetical protein [Rhizobium sp. SORGH_AS_0787]